MAAAVTELARAAKLQQKLAALQGQSLSPALSWLAEPEPKQSLIRLIARSVFNPNRSDA